MGNVRALAEAVATFDQVFQPLGEARCRSPVDDRVIETQGHAEIFADDYLPINDAWLRSYATQGNIKGMVVDRDAPACTFRSEEHTSELQSRRDLVCRLLLEKKKIISKSMT